MPSKAAGSAVKVIFPEAWSCTPVTFLILWLCNAKLTRNKAYPFRGDTIARSGEVPHKSVSQSFVNCSFCAVNWSLPEESAFICICREQPMKGGPRKWEEIGRASCREQVMRE